MKIDEILIIDDDSIINFIHSKIIESEVPNVPIIIFLNGAEAFQYIQKNSKLSFLIFLDINMPVMNGWQFIEALLPIQNELNLHIHLLTSSIDDRDKDKANKYSLIKSFISKPLTTCHLKILRDNREKY